MNAGPPRDTIADVIVVGAGLIGLAVAWRARQRGLTVTVCDPDPVSGASRAAAGMLAPVLEAHYGEERTLPLNLASARRYPAFVAELEELTGLDTGYRRHGTLAVALDADDRTVLTDLRAFQATLGLDSQWLTARECRRLEPMLAPAIRGGLLVTGDHQVDNRRLGAALLRATAVSGVSLRRERVVELLVTGDRATGVRLAGGDRLGGDALVLAAGCHSDALPGLPPEVVPPVRPVKGQILRLRVPAAQRRLLSRTVRGVVRGGLVYLVERDDGELVVGATAEERGYDSEVTAGGVYALLRDAHELVPGITELPLVETLAGLRPGSPDNAPLVGPSGLPGLVLATGHFRNGVLLTPVTADAVAELLVTGVSPPELAPCAPARFGAGTAWAGAAGSEGAGSGVGSGVP